MTNSFFNKHSFLIAVTFLAVNICVAQPTAKKSAIYASENSTNAYSYTTIPANIIYPTLLQGNEEQSLAYIEKFSKNRAAYITRTFTKSKKYFPKVVKILNKYHLPKEYQVLLPLESGFNGNAVSSAGAVGFWQIMDEVAKEYGLQYIPQPTAAEKLAILQASKVVVTVANTTPKNVVKKTIVKDDRKNFLKSTTTAAKYLKDRTRNLDNNLLLIVASYNCGVGNVWEAKRKTGLTNPTFWDVKKYLPSETQAYVMNFITLNVLFHNYQKFANQTLTFQPSYQKLLIQNNDEQVKVNNSTSE